MMDQTLPSTIRRQGQVEYYLCLHRTYNLKREANLGVINTHIRKNEMNAVAKTQVRLHEIPTTPQQYMDLKLNRTKAVVPLLPNVATKEKRPHTGLRTVSWSSASMVDRKRQPTHCRTARTAFFENCTVSQIFHSPLLAVVGFYPVIDPSGRSYQ